MVRQVQHKQFEIRISECCSFVWKLDTRSNISYDKRYDYRYLFKKAAISAGVMKKSLNGNKEYEKMLAGETYNSFDKDLILARTITSGIASEYADIKLSDHGYDIAKHQKSRADYFV